MNELRLASRLVFSLLLLLPDSSGPDGNAVIRAKAGRLRS